MRNSATNFENWRRKISYQTRNFRNGTRKISGNIDLGCAIFKLSSLVKIVPGPSRMGGCGGCDTPPENKLSANEGICRQTKNNIPQNVKLNRDIVFL